MKSNNSIGPKIFHSALFVTLLSGALALWFSTQESLSPRQEQLYEISTSLWTTGVCTIFKALYEEDADCIAAEKEE